MPFAAAKNWLTSFQWLPKETWQQTSLAISNSLTIERTAGNSMHSTQGKTIWSRGEKQHVEGEDEGRLFAISNVEHSWEWFAQKRFTVISSVISFKQLNGIVQQMLRYSTRSVITTSTFQLHVDYVSLVNSFLPHLPIFSPVVASHLCEDENWPLTVPALLCRMQSRIVLGHHPLKSWKAHHVPVFPLKRKHIMVLQSTTFGKGWECENWKGVWRHRGWWLETFSTTTRLMYVLIWSFLKVITNFFKLRCVRWCWWLLGPLAWPCKN